jgi:hypothetical protein
MLDTYNTNLSNLPVRSLKPLNVPVTASDLQQQLMENLFYPTLYSLSYVSESFYFNTAALKSEKENFDNHSSNEKKDMRGIATKHLLTVNKKKNRFETSNLLTASICSKVSNKR